MVLATVAVVCDAGFVAARTTIYVARCIFVAVAGIDPALLAAEAIVPAKTRIDGLALGIARAIVRVVVLCVVVLIGGAHAATVHLEAGVVALTDIGAALITITVAGVGGEVVVIVWAIARVALRLIATLTDVLRSTDLLVAAVADVARRCGVVARGAGTDVQDVLVSRALGAAVVVRLCERRSGQAAENGEVHEPQPCGAAGPAQEVAAAGIGCRVLDSLGSGRMVEQDATH